MNHKVHFQPSLVGVKEGSPRSRRPCCSPVRVIILCSFITYVFVLIAHERILHDVSNVHDAAASNPSHHHPFLMHSHRPRQVGEAAVVGSSGRAAHRHVHHAKLLECDKDVDGDGSEDRLVYWHSDASRAADDAWVSPWARRDGRRRYVTFEADTGGFNNVRSELVISFFP
jgi:hypothetical protein